MNEPKILLQHLNFSRRTYNALKRAGIESFQELITYPQNELLKIKNLGQKSLNEIISFIDEVHNGKQIICSSISTQQLKIFLGLDGKKYNDILLEDLNLSVRAYNCLKSANINYYSDLIFKDDDDLISITNMGKKSLLEIEYIKNNTVLTIFNDVEENKITPDSIINVFFSSINEKFNINPVLFFEKLRPTCKLFLEETSITDLPNCLDDKSFLNNVYSLKFIHDIFKEYILSIIKKHIYGCDDNYFVENMPVYFNNFSFVNDLLNELYNENKIELFNDEEYIISYPPFDIGVKEILSDKEYQIFIQRTEGKTLDQIGKDLSVTRERIRQLEAKSIRELNKKAAIFKEDIFLDIFMKYSMESEDFSIAFKDYRIYNYLSLRYNAQKDANIDNKLPLSKVLEDRQVPLVFKRALEKSVYKNYVKICNEYISCTRADICNFVLKTFATDDISFEEFSELYTDVLKDIGRQDDFKLSLLERGYGNKLASSNIVLWKYGKKFRYYNMAKYNYEELLDSINLNQYTNVEYSTLKFFRLYPEIMETYDIRDEYELHNLLKKICSKEQYPTITFKRMPNIEFGNANRDEQVMELLCALAPISNNDFAKEYENEYGVIEGTVLANYMKSFDKYFYNGVYKIDFPTLPNEVCIELRTLLVKDFYTMTELKDIFNRKYSYLKSNLLNPFTIKSLGFKVYSNYIIKDIYISATDYFNRILTNDDITNLDNFPAGINNIIAYTSSLYKLKSDYEIIEFLPNKYINFRRLEQFGVTKDALKKYCDDVLKFIGESKYFTIKSIREEGFFHELDDLGFEDWFYTSILIQYKNNISYLRIGGNKLMISGQFNITLEAFIEYIVYSQESFSIDIYELLSFLISYYNINIDVCNLIATIKASSMFYDTVSEKVYADYETYYEEI